MSQRCVPIVGMVFIMVGVVGWCGWLVGWLFLSSLIIVTILITYRFVYCFFLLLYDVQCIPSEMCI